MRQKEQILLGHHHKINKIESQINPPLRLVDKLIQHAPHVATMSIHQMRKGFGFRKIHSIIKEIQHTSNNLRISTLDREPILDLGEVSSIDRSNVIRYHYHYPKTLVMLFTLI